MKITSLIICAVLIVYCAFSQEKQYVIDFNKNEFMHEYVLGYDYFSGKGFSRGEQLGEPDLPYYTVNVLDTH